MWMKVDDGLHAHRKTRAVTKSHADKGRDAAPMGLWVLAGSWAAQNSTDGWVPEDELDRWDSGWKALARRLVEAGYWWPSDRDGEPGFGFTDWHDYNDPSGAASKAGSFGNHVRWHVNEGKVIPDCDHCPKEPDAEPDEPEYRPDVAPESGGDRGAISPPTRTRVGGAIALPEPEPDPNPTRNPGTTSSDKSDQMPERFDEFWDAYDKKDGRKRCVVAYRNALKKPGVTPDLLISAAHSYIEWVRSEGKHPQFTKNPLTWLHGEHWTDERAGRTRPQTRVQEHLTLVQQLAAEEAEQPTLPQIGRSLR